MKLYKSIILILIFYTINTFSAFSSQIPLTKDSRIKDLLYNPNSIYELKFHHGYQSFIEFSKQEEIDLISIGESFAWRLFLRGRKLYIRPLETSTKTNMIIETNKRTYLFSIESSSYEGKADEKLALAVRFYYPKLKKSPKTPPVKLKQPNLPKINPNQISHDAALDPKSNLNQINDGSALDRNFKGKITSPITKLNVGKKLPDQLKLNSVNAKINFKYSMVGDKGSNINPIAIFDDGKNTYFQFKNKNLIIPSISAVREGSSVDTNSEIIEEKLGYSIKDNFVVIPSIEKQFTLRSGKDLLCIFNDKLSLDSLAKR